MRNALRSGARQRGVDASIPPLKDGDGIGARHFGVCSLPSASPKVHCSVPVRPVLPPRPTSEIRSCSQGVLSDPHSPLHSPSHVSFLEFLDLFIKENIMSS